MPGEIISSRVYHDLTKSGIDILAQKDFKTEITLKTPTYDYLGPYFNSIRGKIYAIVVQFGICKFNEHRSDNTGIFGSLKFDLEHNELIVSSFLNKNGEPVEDTKKPFQFDELGQDLTCTFTRSEDKGIQVQIGYGIYQAHGKSFYQLENEKDWACYLMGGLSSIAIYGGGHTGDVSRVLLDCTKANMDGSPIPSWELKNDQPHLAYEFSEDDSYVFQLLGK